ncbi:hypothetical protein J8273_6787 [Carpediemonas membranifera]|uniref:Uncharacterized protein n=1 Tax=Carpediemonas membranifera TaxID=201153 RepID=A0A8J6DYB2_9EUKA|nr:hypothetical protein J8273_6787 [Carpediemonas membranifera]|eukprot:KAG9391899.1 hypothetical protein J8273_6787 [Carpediemonas membranifera]
MSLAESASSGSVGSSSVAIADTGASASAITPTARAKAPKRKLPFLTSEIDVEQFLSSWASSTKLEAAGARELKFISKSDLKSVIRNERVQSVERICNIAWVAYQMELYNELENDGVAIDDCIVPTEQLEVLQARVSEALMRPTRELIDGTRKVWNYRATYAGMVKSICDSMATMLFIDPGTVTRHYILVVRYMILFPNLFWDLLLSHCLPDTIAYTNVVMDVGLKNLLLDTPAEDDSSLTTLIQKKFEGDDRRVVIYKAIGTADEEVVSTGAVPQVEEPDE